MSKITEIKKARRGGRLLVKLEDGRMLRVTPETAAEYSLAPEGELDEGLFEKLESGGGLRIEEVAAGMLSRRQMTVGQLGEKLTERGYTDEEIAALNEDFIRWGFLDDRRYCEQLADYCGGKNMSARGFANELYRRRVPRELWDYAISLLPTPEGAIDALLASRLRGRPMDKKTRDSAINYLRARGFAWDDIRAALERREETDTEETDTEEDC